MDTTRRRRIFRDVVRGYSAALLDEKFVYIKHLTPHDQVELEEIEEKYFEVAKKRGVPTEKDMLEFLSEEGQWSESDEKFIKDKQAFLESLKTARKKLVLKKEIDSQDRIIERENTLLVNKQQEKIKLVGNTCEKYAKDRMNDFYMIKSFYKDPNLKQELFGREDFDDLEDLSVSRVVRLYNETFENFTEENIQYTILEDFYNPYLSFAEDSMQFYGKPFCELTYNQIRLIVYSRVFKNIFDYNDNIPESIMKDPAKLLEFGSSSRQEREKVANKLNSGDGSTLVGAKDEDYEYLGIEKPRGGIDLHDEVKKKGGTLNMEDLMKLHGVE